MGTTIPKQFLEVRSKPVLLHTLEKFHSFDPSASLLLVLPKDHFALWQALIAKHTITIPHTLVEGGTERFFSVKNALDSLSNEEAMVAIHDGVRPLVSHQTIQNTLDAAAQHGAAIPVTELKESIRIIENGQSVALDRSKYRLVQTPQCFTLALLKEAYNQPFSTLFTDDASVVEALGHSVQLVAGNDENIKITTPSDIVLAEALLKG